MKRLGKYEILEALGTGGMGNVYRARDTVLEREVAVKTIHTGGDVDPERMERFYREARACARLHHPHIVTVYDLGEQDGIAYIVMELLVGSDLRRIIADKQAIPLETRIELLVQVSEGLGHAHANGIIHRDIKPGNVFVQRDNRAKILDFGVARIGASQLTRVGLALGTPDYMAPEQIAGQVCDARSDLFSAAVVFSEFLTYTHPFAGRSIARQIVCDDPTPLRAADPLLPVSLERVITKGLEKNPDRRYQTGEELAAALRGVIDEIRQRTPEAGFKAVPAAEAAEPLDALYRQVEQFLARLQQALEEQNRSASASLAEQLRPLLKPAAALPGAGELRSRAETTLLLVDLDLARAVFAQKMRESDLAGAEKAFAQLDALALREPGQIQEREQCRRQLEELREEDRKRRRMADYRRAQEEFDAAIERESFSGSRLALERIRELAAVDGRFAAAVEACEKRLAALVPRPRKVPEPVMEALRRRARQLFDQDYEACVEFVESLGAGHQADPELARLKEQAQAYMKTQPPDGGARPNLGNALQGEASESPARAGPGTGSSGARAVAAPAGPRGSTAVEEPAPGRTGGARPATHPGSSRPASFPKLKPLVREPSPGAGHPSGGLGPARKWIVAAFALLVLVLALVIWYHLRTPTARLVPPVAVAEVMSLEAGIFAEPSAGAPTLASIKRGVRVNVLSLPRSRQQEWIQVRYEDGSNSPFRS